MTEQDTKATKSTRRQERKNAELKRDIDRKDAQQKRRMELKDAALDRKINKKAKKQDRKSAEAANRYTEKCAENWAQKDIEYNDSIDILKYLEDESNVKQFTQRSSIKQLKIECLIRDTIECDDISDIECIAAISALERAILFLYNKQRVIKQTHEVLNRADNESAANR